jgi:hypothetical protein
MHVPKWAIAMNFVLLGLVAFWAAALSLDRNPLPWPDSGSRIFAASSPKAKAAVVELLAKHGVAERFKVNTSGILRSIMWDGTIINYSPASFTKKIGDANSAIGLVSDDPLTSAKTAAQFLRSKGFRAEVVEDAEPNLPIYFVTTDAMVGTAINFRPHVSKMPTPK